MLNLLLLDLSVPIILLKWSQLFRKNMILVAKDRHV